MRNILRVAMLMPGFIPVPPPTYGGTEGVGAVLTDELMDEGYDVELIAAPGSKTKAPLRSMLETAFPNDLGNMIIEMDHVVRALEYIEKNNFDVIHDHTMTAVALADRLNTPLVHTMHNGHHGYRTEFYRRLGCRAHLVAI